MLLLLITIGFVIAALLLMAWLKDVPGLADPEPLQPRNVRTVPRALHPASNLSDAAVDRILAAIREEEGL